jgi:hypothetical protein
MLGNYRVASQLVTSRVVLSSLQSVSYLYDLHAVCGFACVFVNLPSIYFWIPESVFMKFGTYCVVPETISTAWFINLTYQFVCLYVCSSICCSLKVRQSIPLFIAGQRLGKHVPAATNKCNDNRIVGYVCLWACPCIPYRCRITTR